MLDITICCLLPHFEVKFWLFWFSGPSKGKPSLLFHSIDPKIGTLVVPSSKELTEISDR